MIRQAFKTRPNFPAQRLTALLLLFFLMASCTAIPHRAQPEPEPEIAFTAPEQPEVSMRVKLFEGNRTGELTLAVTSGLVRLTGSDGTQIRLSPASPPVVIRISGGNFVEVEHGNNRSRAEQWIAENAPESLIRIVHPVIGWRNYPGTLSFSQSGSRLRIINQAGLEDYVASVTGSEMNFNNAEALKVQAVIARTYALWNKKHGTSEKWDVTDSELNQVYQGEIMFTDRYRKAAEATAGEVLTWSGDLILAAYHSTCGGHTVNNETVWTGGPLPYLRGVRDRQNCSASPHYRWDIQVSRDELESALGITGAISLSHDNHGRVSAVEAETRSGREEWRGNAFRLQFNRHFGSLALRSTDFELEEDGNRYIFRGRGLGHGTGLCQWGALGLAESGWNYADILRFYYSGTEITRLDTIPL